MEGIARPQTQKITGKWLTWSMLGVLSLTGAGIIYYATRWGAVSFSDSTMYILSARSLAAGKGLGIPAPGGGFEALRIHPPMYSIVLAGISLLGLDPIGGARLLAVLSFALMITLVGAINYRLTRQGLLTVLLCAAFLVSPVFISIFSMAMTEGLFYLTGLLSFYFVLMHLERPQPAKLVLSGVMGGLSFLSRYSGAAWVAAGCLVLLVLRRVSWKRRVIECLWLGLPAVALGALWLAPLAVSTHTLGSRIFRVPFELGVDFRSTQENLIDLAWHWLPYTEILLPTRSYALRGYLMLAGVALPGLLALFAHWNINRRGTARTTARLAPDGVSMPGGDVNPPGSQAKQGLFRLVSSLELFGGVYLAIVAFSYFFAVPPSDLNERLLSPVYLAGIWLAAAFLRWFAFSLSATPARLVTGLALLLPLLTAVDGAWRSRVIIVDLHNFGAGYTNQEWQESETIQLLPHIVPDLELISNQSAAILFLTNRPAYDLVEPYLFDPRLYFNRYGNSSPRLMGKAEQLFRQRKAALVVFPKSLYWQLNPYYGEDTQDRMEMMFEGLEVYGPFHDGVIYLYPDD